MRNRFACRSITTVLSLIGWLAQGAQGTLLGDMARALPERTWVKLPANASLDKVDLPYALLYWADSGCWDPVHGAMLWVGATGSCCGDGQYRLLRFDEASDSWSIALTPYQRSGHSYDGNALDPRTGHLYFSLYMDKQVKKWDGESWSLLPDLPYGAVPSVGMAWFPELNGGAGGLVHVGENGSLGWFDGTKWTLIPGGSWGTYNLFAEYNPILKIVWLGAGNGGERINYKLDAQLNLTRMGDAPISLNVGASLKSTDPAGGKYLVTDLTTGDFWEFDANDKGTWVRLTDMQGEKPDLGDGKPVLQTPIPGHGVILYFKHNYAVRDVYLYRHSKSTGASVLSPGPGRRFSISRDAFRGTRISLSDPSRMGKGSPIRLEILAPDGRRVFGRTLDAGRLSEGVSWNPAGGRSGAHFLRATDGSDSWSLPLPAMR